MSNVLKGVATVAGIVAMLPIPIVQPIAAGIAAVATIGAALTQKKPPVAGNLTDITIGANMQALYPIGRTYPRIAMIHDVGYGPTIKDVPNPYRSMVFDLGTGGPIEEIEAIQGDFATISFSAGAASGYYSGFLWADTQLGATPEGSALAGPHGAIPQWGSAYKLSGHAAMLLTLKFDRKGKVWAAGVPQWGAIVKGALVYDPRQDSTYPGGSGAARALDETTYLGSPTSYNPGCHAVTYALGRWQNGKKVFGCGFAVDAIDWPAWVEFMNVCDANGWEIGGTIFEPGSRWDNLKRICQAGGAKPVFVGGLLSVVFPRPRVALDTITANDVVGEVEIAAMKGWRDRLNGIVPKYRSEAHKWEMVQSDLVSVSTYVTEDGEEKNEERDYELVQDKDQAAQLAAYDLVNGREFTLSLPCKPRLIRYRVGDAMEVDLPDEGLSEQLCAITDRRVNPATGTVEFSFESETSAKHAFALAETGTAPPTPTITTGEEMDEAVSVVAEEQFQTAIRSVYPTGLAVEGRDTDGVTGEIELSNHVHEWPSIGAVAVTGTTLLGLTLGATYYLYADVDEYGDDTPTFGATTVYGDALNSEANPNRVYLHQSVPVPTAGNPPEDGGGFGGGYGGGGGTVLP